ncbi:elongator complex protein 3 [Acidaminobacter hydrogenoformans]|uniref:Radical_SAM C-terminal domain-containing protein n=1 Tax=Acidaminobacter hydrogenoformans DSM 2784 TaxID=1120920 RepID=A0A1G5RS64_9FIRM|nr:radical SAM protein [Acidaminobacter hydrogenoformans]SCZ76912.1 Radical_SAM C-terminal domain-containing protein [Acidaminobacter hydrogenoformans DSM 2784]
MIIPIFIPHLGCPNQCVFCNQKTITGIGEGKISVEAARTEIEDWLGRSGNGAGHELAFYGGSFTALPLSLQMKYLELADTYRKRGSINALRLSTRPDAIDPDHLKTLKAFGVSRIELGAQSFDDRVLSMSQRGHCVRDIEVSSRMILEADIDLGLQIMVGLPGDSALTDLKGVSEAFRLGATTLRIYPTLVLKGTMLEKMFLQGDYSPLTLEMAVQRVARMMEAVDAMNAEKAGSPLQLIRIGLQENEMLRGSGEVLAGPHHPAFRTLVDSYRFKAQLDQDVMRFEWRGERLEARVHSRAPGSFAGHNKSNLIHLKSNYGVVGCKIIRDDTVPEMRYVIRIIQEKDKRGR